MKQHVTKHPDYPCADNTCQTFFYTNTGICDLGFSFSLVEFSSTKLQMSHFYSNSNGRLTM